MSPGLKDRRELSSVDTLTQGTQGRGHLLTMTMTMVRNKKLVTKKGKGVT
jgi:hypothetical protein